MWIIVVNRIVRHIRIFVPGDWVPEAYSSTRIRRPEPPRRRRIIPLIRVILARRIPIVRPELYLPVRSRCSVLAPRIIRNGRTVVTHRPQPVRNQAVVYLRNPRLAGRSV